MPRILYVSHTSQLGGAEISLLTLLKHLDRARFEPAVALPRPGPLAARLDELDVRHYDTTMKRLRRTHNPFTLFRQFSAWRRASWQIVQHIDTFKPDLVHANSTTAYLFASPAAVARNIPAVWHVRDIRSRVGTLGHRMVQDAAAIVAVSNAVKDRLPYLDLAAPKTSVIYNGVDTAAFAPGDHVAVRKELGFDDNAPLAGILGQLVPWKRHDLFLEATPLVARQLPAARFLVVGDDRFGDFPRLLNKLKRRARSLGLADSVIFTGWRDDVPAVLNALDLLVLTSESEPFGRVLIEAMACAKPVVAFRDGGPAEIIEHEQTGLLVPPGNVNELAAAMTRLLTDRETAASFGSRGRRTACERFSAQASAAAVQRLYDRLLH